MSEADRPAARTGRPHRTPQEVLFLSRRHLARTALGISVIAALVLAAGVFGVHEEMFAAAVGLNVLILGWAPNLALLGAGLGVLSLIAAFIIIPRRERATALAAVAVGAGVIAISAQVRAGTAGQPPIHDVATDWNDPLMFGPVMMDARGLNANAVEANPAVLHAPATPQFEGLRVAQINASTCPGAVPLVLTGGVAQAYAKAKAAVQKAGLKIVTDNPAGGRLEATGASLWFNAKDDLLVRVRPDGAGARIDMRSIRRVGTADYGANCRRVTALRKAMAR